MTDLEASIKKLLPWLVAVAFFMEALDTTILNTAVPVVAAALKVTPLSMKSVLSSYTLSLAIFIPVSSWVADRFGTRRVFSAAIALFTLGSFFCGISSDIHWLVFCRILQGCGGAMMVPVGRLTLVRAFDKSELIRAMTFVAIPALIGPMLGPLAGGFIIKWFHWRVIFFVNLPIGFTGLYLVFKHLPDYHELTDRLDLLGMILFGTSIALLSYVLEVFGEHTLSPREVAGLFAMSGSLMLGYILHANKMRSPLLDLHLFRIRTLRIAVLGNFITRLGVGGLPFLLPLLYQIGMGFSPIESGLLIVPQSLAALILKMYMPSLLARFGYRKVLLSNTIFLGATIALFATIGPGTPVWLIITQACVFGFLSSLQYTSMNTLVYSDITPPQTSMTSTITSTVQQMSLSFGVATSSLVAAYFIPNRSAHTDPANLVHGLHSAFIFLGVMTVLSAIVFRKLRDNDGDNISRHNVVAEH